MAPLLDNSAILKNHDSLCIGDRRQLMADYERRLAGCESIQGFDHPAFTGRIEPRSGLVQDHNGCVSENGSGNCQTAFLPSGQPRTRLAQLSLISLGQLLNELMSFGCPGSRNDFFLSGPDSRKGDVLPDRGIEDVGIL